MKQKERDEIALINSTAALMSAVEQRVANESKSVVLAYVYWIFLGTLGVHRFYLEDFRWGGTILYLNATGIISLLCAIFIQGMPAILSTILFIAALASWGIMGILLLIDLVAIPFVVEYRRQEIRENLVSELRNSGVL